MLTNLVDQSFNYVIRLGAIGSNSNSSLLAALKHNDRTAYIKNNRYPDHIDSSRTALNYSLVKGAASEDIVINMTNKALNAGVKKFRSNQIMGVEIIFSLPANRLLNDHKGFFFDCHEWTKNSFPDCEVISFDVHLDQKAPHAHAIIFPLRGGKMEGSKLLGGRARLKGYVNDFHNKVGVNHGMSKAQKISKKYLAEVERLVLTSLGADPIKQSILWAPVRDEIHSNPLPYAYQLGLYGEKSKSPRRDKSFVEIMTGKGKASAKHDKAALNKLSEDGVCHALPYGGDGDQKNLNIYG